MIITILSLFISIGGAKFQKPTETPNYKVYQYTLQHGLAFNNVNGIAQDSTGFVWVATEDGLSRFDGKYFKNFKYDAKWNEGLAGNYVQAVLMDADGVLWLTSRTGISKFNSQLESFTHYPILEGTSGQYKMDVGAIGKSANSTILWISANGLGIYRFDKQNGDFIRYTTESLLGLRSNMTTSCFEDSKGRLWIGTQGHGFQVFQVRGKEMKHLSAFDKLQSVDAHFRVHQFFEDKNGRMFVATDKGLLIYDSRAGTHKWVKGTAFGLPNDRFLSTAVDAMDQIYVGLQDGGCYKMDVRTVEGGTIEVMGFRNIDNNDDLRPHGITKRSVPTLFFDRDQNLWAGTYGDGLFLLAKPKYDFSNFPKTRLLPPEMAKEMRFYGITEDENDNLFLGTDGHGLFVVDRQNRLLKHFKQGDGSGITDNAILVGFKDHAHRLWFGTYNGGLLLFRPESNSFKSYLHDQQEKGSLAVNDVRAIYEDHDHQLWIGTNGGGLHKLNASTGKFTQYAQHNSSIPSNDIRSIVEDEKGNLIIGTYGAGITYFDPKKERFSAYLLKDDTYCRLNAEVIYDLYVREDGKLWIATEGNGLLVCDMDSREIIQSYNESKGLASNTVLAVIGDDARQCWVSTNKGLSSIGRKTTEIHNYSSMAGLQSGIFNPRSVLYSPARRQLFFGGTGGLTYFDPSALEIERNTYPIIFTGLEVFGKEVPIAGEKGYSILSKSINDTEGIVLNPDQSTFTLQYAALDFGMSGETNFVYRLKGLDKEWNFVHDNQSATYHYLAPGDYTFEVALEHAGTVLEKSMRSLRIQVLPPWYRTWWAYLFYLSTISCLVFFYMRYKRQKQELKYQLKISQLEHEKDKELNEVKINFYMRLSHEFRSTLTLILNPVKDLLHNNGIKQQIAPSLNTLYINTNRLLRLSNQVLTISKGGAGKESLSLENVDVVALANDVLSCFEHQAKQKGIALILETHESSMPVLADREKLEIVLFNLVFNAVKFTKSGWIRITINPEGNDRLIIHVKDSGCGIDKAIGDRLFEQFVHHKEQDQHHPMMQGFGVGLWMVKYFVEMHRGIISYQSELGKGTCFLIDMPTGKEKPANDPERAEMTQAVGPSTLMVVDDKCAPVEKMKLAGGTISTIKMLVVDDDAEMTHYLHDFFEPLYEVIAVHEVDEAQEIMKEILPDIILCDIMMKHSNGIEFCQALKSDDATRHIPIILLTAMHSVETQLDGLHKGADDYIIKPFDKEVLRAKVSSLLKTRNNLKEYFYNGIAGTLDYQKISPEEKALLEKCIAIVEKNIDDEKFNVQKLAASCGMTYATLSNHIKSINGLTLNAFIRTIRLQQAARLFLNTDATIYEVADRVGIRDLKYFREQFAKQYGMNPSAYIKKYRKPFHGIYHPN
ncbi:hybrid sensor histidine kinase/response regulator transcription factor [Olivibacter sitiensis]|uniref:hybrid sensor histidine kinase/response regulator transcription factor n=1 Tax=Olivibacter sitiensis TaxID=376470 RepID=UPI0004231ADC|nr:two-component regulator propeller domain-containing protein [Olivibacter sitiensis]